MVTLSLSCLILSVSPEEGHQDDSKGRQEEKEEEDVLDRKKCQAALASLRHAKWFQVSTAGLMTQSLSLSLHSASRNIQPCLQTLHLDIL